LRGRVEVAIYLTTSNCFQTPAVEAQGHGHDFKFCVCVHLKRKSWSCDLVNDLQLFFDSILRLLKE